MWTAGTACIAAAAAAAAAGAAGAAAAAAVALAVAACEAHAGVAVDAAAEEQQLHIGSEHLAAALEVGRVSAAPVEGAPGPGERKAPARARNQKNIGVKKKRACPQ